MKNRGGIKLTLLVLCWVLSPNSANAVNLKEASFIKAIPNLQWRTGYREVVKAAEDISSCHRLLAVLGPEPENATKANDDKLIYLCESPDHPSEFFLANFFFRQRHLNQITIFLPLNSTAVEHSPIATAEKSNDLVAETLERASHTNAIATPYSKKAKAEVLKRAQYPDPQMLQTRVVEANRLSDKQTDEFLKEFSTFLTDKKNGAAQYISREPGTDTRAEVFFKRDEKTGDYLYLDYAPMRTQASR